MKIFWLNRIWLFLSTNVLLFSFIYTLSLFCQSSLSLFFLSIFFISLSLSLWQSSLSLSLSIFVLYLSLSIFSLSLFVNLFSLSLSIFSLSLYLFLAIFSLSLFVNLLSLSVFLNFFSLSLFVNLLSLSLPIFSLSISLCQSSLYFTIFLSHLQIVWNLSLSLPFQFQRDCRRERKRILRKNWPKFFGFKPVIRIYGFHDKLVCLRRDGKYLWGLKRDNLSLASVFKWR